MFKFPFKLTSKFLLNLQNPGLNLIKSPAHSSLPVAPSGSVAAWHWLAEPGLQGFKLKLPLQFQVASLQQAASADRQQRPST